MRRLSATIRLRPIRVALLARPSDLASIRQFMRICTCMWGGVFNPIIPVYRSRPLEWRRDPLERLTGAQVTQGYVDYFEPDTFVEAEPGLIEKSGLHALHDPQRPGERAFSLSDLLTCQDHRDWSELIAGLEIIDVLQHIYKTERRFALRDARPAILPRSLPHSAVIESLFGVYPTRQENRHFGQAYVDVFHPDQVAATPDTWRSVYLQGAVIPLAVTRHALEYPGIPYDNLVIYVFDGTRITDLIDLWNLRLEPRRLLPIPAQWWPDLVGDVATLVEEQYRPLPDNQHGVMQHTTIEVSRSISDDDRSEILSLLSPQLPQHAWVCKPWRTRVWSKSGLQNDTMRRLRVTAGEKHVTLSVRDDNTTDLKGLAPTFASLYARGERGRWVNVVEPGITAHQDIATVLPFSVKNSSWPRLDRSAPVVVGSEGWSFAQRFKDLTTTVHIETPETVMVGSFDRSGVHARLSEAGRIAKQVLYQLGGTWGIRLLADAETLKLLNDMSGGIRRRRDGETEDEEVFDRRSRPKRTWDQLMSSRAKRRRYENVTVSDFTDRNVLRLGIVTKCGHCTFSNWHSLTDTDYAVTCARCLEEYPFPQGSWKGADASWAYRVIGPFATPDYARGSYGALLAVDVLLRTSMLREATVSPALTLEWTGSRPCEVDYAAWVGRKTHDGTDPPDLLVGEAKSMGRGDLIKSHDLAKLRTIGKRLPGATIVISVMRAEFNDGEKERLRPFAKWARRPDKSGNPTNPLILLTGVELFHQLDLRSTWREKGGQHAELASYENTHDLRRLAEVTQALYLA